MWMFCISIEHRSSCDTFFLINCKNIANFVLLLWTCLALLQKTIMSICRNFEISLHAKKWTQLLTYFLWYCNLFTLSNFRIIDHEYQEIMIVSLCRKLWWPKCWNQLAGNFNVYAKKIEFISNFFFKKL